MDLKKILPFLRRSQRLENRDTRARLVPWEPEGPLDLPLQGDAADQASEGLFLIRKREDWLIHVDTLTALTAELHVPSSFSIIFVRAVGWAFLFLNVYLYIHIYIKIYACLQVVWKPSHHGEILLRC